MSSKLGDALRRLCFQYGWSYGIYWRFHGHGVDSGLLTAGRAYHKDHLGNLISNVVRQVHRVGEGVIGTSALNGTLNWIFSDAHMKQLGFNDATCCSLQFQTGIKTIAILPLQPLGVLQFGSHQKIPENLEFINQVKDMIQNTELLPELFICGNSQGITTPQTYDSCGIFNTSTAVAEEDYFNGYTDLDYMNSMCSNLMNTVPPAQKIQPPFITDDNYTAAGDHFFVPSSNQDFAKHVSTSPVGLSNGNDEILALMEQQLLQMIRSSQEIDNGSSDLASISLKEFPNLTSVDVQSDVKESNTTITAATTANNNNNGNNNSNNNSDGHLSMLFSDHELFTGTEFDLRVDGGGQSRQCYWDDAIIMPEETTGLLESIPQLGLSGMGGRSEKDIFSELDIEQLVYSIAATRNNNYSSTNSLGSANSQNRCSSPANVANQYSSSSDVVHPKSQVGCWNDDCYNMNNAASAAANSSAMNATQNNSKPLLEQAKEVPPPVRKRARAGESTRPRPKDRQLIQDRVKELREIVPNGAKCSIDSLLDRTIKHMMFLQNVTKYAEKIKQTEDDVKSKMIGEESCVILRDKSSGCSPGATWAFEVAGQTMVCPIILEDLSPPGQMHVEMLCEERGFFLEIADIIRGFGLIILKGMMEVHHSRMWARFVVEANREVTRMEIFLSLVKLLQQTSSNSNVPTTQGATIVEMESSNVLPRFENYELQPPFPIPISLDRLQ